MRFRKFTLITGVPDADFDIYGTEFDRLLTEARLAAECKRQEEAETARMRRDQAFRYNKALAEHIGKRV